MSAPALDPDWSGPSGQQVEELGVEVTALVADHAPELGGQGETAGGGERFADLGDGELAQCPLVDELRIGAQRQAQHHVGEVDGLAPWARAGLDERHVDQQQVAVADQQVGRFDVAVGKPGIPQLADHCQAVVDDAVVDVGLAEFGGMVEELGDEQVLAFRGELHEAIGAGGGQASGVQLVQRVVLLLHQAPHRVERFLVLQPAIPQFSAELVPAVGAQVTAGVELGEQPGAPGRR